MAGLTVAITGSAGFFGRALVRALEQDDDVDRVLALDGQPPLQQHPKTHWFKLDLVHPRSSEQLARLLEKTDALVHTAFLARPTHRGGWAHELEAIGTRHVLAAVEATGVRKLVLRSSTLSYGALPTNPAYLPETAPLRGGEQSSFVADKVEAERQTAAFAHKHPDRVVTVLRLAALLGPTADTIATNYFRHRACAVQLGFDPLVQLLHEDDAIEAVRRSLHVDVRGAVNVAAPGVLPLTRAIRAAGAVPVPLPARALRGASKALWALQVGEFPPGFIDHLRYAFVADTRLMSECLGFAPRYDIRAALTSFARAARAA